MRPKFEVGEVVILQSLSLPQYNGEHVIHAVIQGPGRHKCRLSPFILEFDGRSPFGYVFTQPLLDTNEVDGVEAVFSESSLRKKHIPGELNFRELMTSLSSPKLLTHSPQ